MFGKEKNIWIALSEYRREIMGFAAIIITVMHLYVSFYEDAQIPYLTVLLKRGNLGVDIFLILSGCGLFFSLEKSKDIQRFYKRRVTRVLFPYLILSVPYWILLDLIVDSNVGQFCWDLFLVSFWTQGITHYWFVAFIIPMYVFFPLIYKVQKKNNTYILILCALSIIVSSIIAFCNKSYYMEVEIAITRIPSFLMGSYLGEIIINDKDKRAKETKVFNCYFLISFVVFLFSIVLEPRNAYIADMFYRYGSAGAGLFLVLIVIFLLQYKPEGLISRLLLYFGDITLEIYIITQSVRNGILLLGLGMNYSIGVKLIIETATFIGCTLLSKLVKRIQL